MDSSLWIKSIANSIPSYSTVATSIGTAKKVQVAVIGAGIVGLTAALKLAENKINVAVFEASKVGRGVSGNTTAKLSSLHRIKYVNLKDSFGHEGAKLYADFNESGIDLVEKNVKDYGLSCDFQRTKNYTFTFDSKHTDLIKKEAEATNLAGLNTKFIPAGQAIGLPFEHNGAIMLDNQAQFNSYAYCLGLAEQITQNGKRVYENSRVTDISWISNPYRIFFENGATIEADKIILATGLPITDRSGHIGFIEPVQSYCSAYRLKNQSDVPDSMYITAEEFPYSLSVRSAQLKTFLHKNESQKDNNNENEKILVLCSGGHIMGDEPFEPDGSDGDPYTILDKIAIKHFPVVEHLYKWGGSDYKTVDDLPYVGYLDKLNLNAFTATGFDKWGLAAGSAAGLSIADMILSGSQFPLPWSKLLDARRWDLKVGLSQLAKFQLRVSKHLLGDRLKDLVAPPIDQLNNGEGAISKLPSGDVVAAFRDDSGIFHLVSPTCTHLGCHCKWNKADKTWDCPCHGSRFSYDGAVLHGPAVKPLKHFTFGKENTQ